MKIDQKKKLESFFVFIKNNKKDYGLSSLWVKYINDFNLRNLDDYRPSYGINYKVSNKRIIFQLGLEKFFNKLNSLIFKINTRLFSYLSTCFSFFGYSNYKKFGIYLKDNKFYSLAKTDNDFRKFLQKHLDLFDWNYSYMSVKAAYNLFCLKSFLDFNSIDSKNIIEIGSGLCQFSCMLSSNLKSFNYVCLDLPNMIPHGYKTLSDNLTNTQIFLPNEIDKFNMSNHDKKIIFILPHQLSEIDLFFDFLVNIESFGEMPQLTANNYIESVTKKMNDKAFIFLINRIARCVDISNKSDIKSWTQFSEYPLDKFDVIVKKIDDFKDLSTDIEGNRSNIFFLGKKAI